MLVDLVMVLLRHLSQPFPYINYIHYTYYTLRIHSTIGDQKQDIVSFQNDYIFFDHPITSIPSKSMRDASSEFLSGPCNIPQ